MHPSLQGWQSRYQTFVGYCYDLGARRGRNPKMARDGTRGQSQWNVDAMFNLAVMNHKEQVRAQRRPRRQPLEQALAR